MAKSYIIDALKALEEENFDLNAIIWCMIDDMKEDGVDRDDIAETVYALMDLMYAPMIYADGGVYDEDDEDFEDDDEDFEDEDFEDEDFEDEDFEDDEDECDGDCAHCILNFDDDEDEDEDYDDEDYDDEDEEDFGTIVIRCDPDATSADDAYCSYDDNSGHNTGLAVRIMMRALADMTSDMLGISTDVVYKSLEDVITPMAIASLMGIVKNGTD